MGESDGLTWVAPSEGFRLKGIVLGRFCEYLRG